MLPTLQWYLFREMGKTFVLAAIGLTAVLGLGGGVMNLIDLEQVTPAQLVRLMLIVLPVAGSLTLPVAAMYSATATYGRLSADNEFVACRSSGINIHRLFLGPLVLSFLVSACSFYFSSFLVPGLIRDLNDLAQVDPRQFVVQSLDSPKRLGFPGMPVKIYADRSASSNADPSAITLEGVAFFEVDDDGKESTYSRYGTAKSIVIRFSNNEQGAMTIRGRFVNATLFDVVRGSWGEAGDQTFGPEVLPQQIRFKVKWLDLGELLHYRRDPRDWPKVAAALASFRSHRLRERFIARVMDDFSTDAEAALADERGTVTVSAEAGAVDAEGESISFSNVTVTDSRGGRSRTITGSKAILSIERSSEEGPLAGVIRIEGNVVIAGGQGVEDRKGREQLTGVVIDERGLGGVDAVDDASLLNPRTALKAGSVASARRQKAMREAGKFVRRVTSELHSRLAFSVSVFVLVVLAAALGVVFRGSHMLAAFGISFVPSLGVMVMNIMGRQLAEKSGTVGLGLATIWGSIVLVVVLDVWLLARVVRR